MNKCQYCECKEKATEKFKMMNSPEEVQMCKKHADIFNNGRLQSFSIIGGKKDE